MRLPNGYGGVVKLSGAEEDLTQPASQQAGTTMIRPENAYSVIRSWDMHPPVRKRCRYSHDTTITRLTVHHLS